MRDELKQFYEEELAAVRNLSRQFATQYPKIANRLLIETDYSADPHVERLIQAFAFLTARIRTKLDDEFPEITQAFLENLYPHLLRPIPSRSIAEFVVDAQQTSLKTRYNIPRHTNLLTKPLNGVPCTFRTSYEVDLWPIAVSKAQFIPMDQVTFPVSHPKAGALLHIQIQCIGEGQFSKMGIEQLRFYIHGDMGITTQIHELLLTQSLEMWLATDLTDPKTRIILKPDEAVESVGFQKTEGLLDYSPRSFWGYSLLQDYFSLPEKFLFFNIKNLKKAYSIQPGKTLDLVFVLNRIESQSMQNRLSDQVDHRTFRLFCSPIINLFKRRGEPITLGHTKSEYPVIVERRWGKGIEVIGIDDVDKVDRSTDKEDIIPVRPIFDFRYSTEQKPDLFWVAHRRPSRDVGDEGTDVFLSIIDRQLRPLSSTGDVITLSVTCSNRDLPGTLPLENTVGELEFETGDPVARIRCLMNPSKSIRPEFERGSLWRLVSHLGLNHLSLTQGGREALQEILYLYCYQKSPVTRKEIESIRNVQSHALFKRIGPTHRSSLIRGTQVVLDLDEDYFGGRSPYILTSVLDQFFALYVTINSFTQLVVTSKQKNGALFEWPARSGFRTLL